MTAKPARPLRVEPLWARVDANRTRLAIFVVAFVAGSAVLLETALVVVPGSLFSLIATDQAEYFSAFGLVVAVSFSALLLGGAFVAAVQLSNAEDWVRARFKGRDLAPDEAPELRRAATDMAIAAGLPAAPRLMVIDASPDSVNAFALGTSRARPLVGVTPGFIANLSGDEQRAVVATLTARIIAGDIMFGTALAALMGPIKAIRSFNRTAGGMRGAAAQAGLADPGCVGRGCSDPGCGGCSGLDDLDSDGCGGAIAFVVFVVIVAIITYAAVVTAAWIVTFWGRALQRTSYEKADAEGMLLLKDPVPMLGALSKTARSSNLVADGDVSYDGIFYTATSGTSRIERVEQRRYERLREVLSTDGVAAEPL